MSKDCVETKEKLLNPYIEICRGSEPVRGVDVNVSSFEDCAYLLLPTTTPEGGPKVLSEPFYSVWGVVGRQVAHKAHKLAYLNAAEPPVSRTLIGFLSEEDLKEKMPRTFRELSNV